jgi:CheY-like chemotaxis protein
VTEKPEALETILVVEDDVLIRMPIAQYLRDCSYRVVEAVSADEAPPAGRTAALPSPKAARA